MVRPAVVVQHQVPVNPGQPSQAGGLRCVDRSQGAYVTLSEPRKTATKNERGLRSYTPGPFTNPCTSAPRRSPNLTLIPSVLSSHRDCTLTGVNNNSASAQQVREYTRITRKITLPLPPGGDFQSRYSPQPGGCDSTHSTNSAHSQNGGFGNISSRSVRSRVARHLHSPRYREHSLEIHLMGCVIGGVLFEGVRYPRGGVIRGGVLSEGGCHPRGGVIRGVCYPKGGVIRGGVFRGGVLSCVFCGTVLLRLCCITPGLLVGGTCF